MTFTTTARTLWYVQNCITCGVPYAVPDHFNKQRLEDKKGFYCPNGHAQFYAESEANLLRGRLAASEGNLKASEERAERERRSHAATKGQLTKTKKRIAGGVCPCCNRSFIDLGRHVAGQHPHYGEPNTQTHES